MSTDWGVDSVTPVNDSLASSVRSFSNGNATFWCRYFSPFPALPASTFDYSGNTAGELDALHHNRINYLVPITSPGSPREGTGGSNGYQFGTLDGSQACLAIATVLSNYSQTIFLQPGPNGSPYLRVYLDVEKDTPLTQDYWNGWADAVFYYNYNGSAPFFPCVYLDPTVLSQCGIVGGGGSPCFGVWAAQPEPCVCTSPGPTWGSYTCSGVANGTRLWQYDEADKCNRDCGSPLPTGLFDLDATQPFDVYDELQYYTLRIP